MNFEWSKRVWVANGLDFKWDLKSGSYVKISNVNNELNKQISVSQMAVIKLIRNVWDYSYNHSESPTI